MKVLFCCMFLCSLGAMTSGFSEEVENQSEVHFSTLRKDFPFFSNNPELIYFDNAATTQKPRKVIDAVVAFYERFNSNIRSRHYAVGEHVTEAVQKARENVAQFIYAKPKEIVFVKGTTEAINFVSSSWGAHNLKEGDEIVVSEAEHNANYLPWRMLAEGKGAILKEMPFNEDGTLDDSFITHKTKFVAVTCSSNVFGEICNIKEIIEKAHRVGARVLVDGAQAVPYNSINVQELGADFFVFSGHKMLAPTGIGVLFIKESLHEETPPYQYGGGITSSVKEEGIEFLEAPEKYEAGTLPLAEIMGLDAAISYLRDDVGFHALDKHTAKLCEKLITGLEKYPEIKILGEKKRLKEKGHLVSFFIEGIDSEDIALVLAENNIAVRSGKMCTHILDQDVIRVSFYMYNTDGEVERFLSVIEDVLDGFRGENEINISHKSQAFKEKLLVAKEERKHCRQ
jgi:cysteine desulfurase / selenocysteine lyase